MIWEFLQHQAHFYYYHYRWITKTLNWSTSQIQNTRRIRTDLLDLKITPSYRSKPCFCWIDILLGRFIWICKNECYKSYNLAKKHVCSLIFVSHPQSEVCLALMRLYVNIKTICFDLSPRWTPYNIYLKKAVQSSL